MKEPTISYQEAREICAKVWPDEPTAREQAERLEDAGWYVDPRWPAVPLGQSGTLIVASIHHRLTRISDDAPCGPGDVTYASRER